MSNDPKYIYDRLRALLGGVLPDPNFKAAHALIELSEPQYRELFASAIGAVSGATSTKKLSDYGRAILKQLEGKRLNAYLDSAGVPTIGYGNTFHPDGRAVKMGDKITDAEADAYLTAILPRYENAVSKIVTAKLTQHQFDALVVFVYNVGSTAFLNGTVDDKLNAGNNDAAIKTWLSYNKVRNPKTGKLEVEKGLNNRRNAEVALFNKK